MAQVLFAFRPPGFADEFSKCYNINGIHCHQNLYMVYRSKQAFQVWSDQATIYPNLSYWDGSGYYGEALSSKPLKSSPPLDAPFMHECTCTNAG